MSLQTASTELKCCRQGDIFHLNIFGIPITSPFLQFCDPHMLENRVLQNAKCWNMSHKFYRHMFFWIIYFFPFETSATASCGYTGIGKVVEFLRFLWCFFWVSWPEKWFNHMLCWFELGCEKECNHRVYLLSRQNNSQQHQNTCLFRFRHSYRYM